MNCFSNFGNTERLRHIAAIIKNLLQNKEYKLVKCVDTSFNV